MKFPMLCALSGLVLFVSCEDKVPAELEKLMSTPQDVRYYESFDEINAVRPVPSKFNLGLGNLLSMAVLRKKSIEFEILPKQNYNATELKINSFFEHPGLQKSLRLLSYARQIGAGHPFRINPFVSYFTERSENQIIADQKVGPAAVVNELFKQKGPTQGSIDFVDYQGKRYQFDVSFGAKSLPMSGSMFLFDHEIFTLNELLADPRQNVLQDVIVHEFTHIWHNELLRKETRDRHTVGSNSTENGHDTQIVSNTNLAFGEGLAEGFEALYGTSASQIMNLTEQERRHFFSRYGAALSEGVEFLVNRQTHVRRNSYLYNLYDFKNCTLRAVRTVSSTDINRRSSSSAELLERIMRGEDVDVNEFLTNFDWSNFSDRFYAVGERVSTTTLRDNCKQDSWNRLESKEGFVATMIYNLLYSGAMVDSDRLAIGDVSKVKNPKQKSFELYAKKEELWSKSWPGIFELTPNRKVAQMDKDRGDRMKEAERLFLLGFRNLAIAIKSGQVITLGGLVKTLLDPNGALDEEARIRVAYQVMKVTKGAFMRKGNSDDSSFVALFADPGTMKRNAAAIYSALQARSSEGELARVIELADTAPSVFVSFKSRLGSSGNRRINANVAHHIDLIDMFGENNAQVMEAAAKLDQGPIFADEASFVSFASSFGQGDKARTMLAEAKKELKENDKLGDNFKREQLSNHSFRKY